MLALVGQKRVATRLKSVGFKIILKPQQPEGESSGRHGKKLLLPERAKLGNEWEQECEVVSVGPRAREEMEKKGRAFEVGDRVVMSVYEGLDGVRSFKHEGVNYLAIDYHKVVGRIPKRTKGRVTVDGRGRW